MANNNSTSRGVFTKRARAKYTQQKLLLSLLKLDTKFLKKYEASQLKQSLYELLSSYRSKLSSDEINDIKGWCPEITKLEKLNK